MRKVDNHICFAVKFLNRLNYGVGVLNICVYVNTANYLNGVVFCNKVGYYLTHFSVTAVHNYLCHFV